MLTMAREAWTDNLPAVCQVLLSPVLTSQNNMQEVLEEISTEFIWLNEIMDKACELFSFRSPGEESGTKQVTVKEMSQAVHNVCKTPKVLSAENSQRVQKTFQQTKQLNDEYSETVCTNKCLSGQQGKENKQPVRKSSSREHAVGFDNKKREVTEVKTSSKDKCEEKNLNVKMYAAASKSVSNHESNKWPAQLGHSRVLRTAERASSKSNSCMKEDTRGKMIENSGSQGVRTSHHRQHEIRTSVSCTSNRSIRQSTKNNCKVSSAPKGGEQKNQMRTRLQQKELKQGEAVDTLKNGHTSTSESGAVLPTSDRTEQTNVFTDVASEDDTVVLSPSKNTRQLNNTLNETVTVVTEVFEFIGKGQPARLKEYEIVKTKMVSDKVKSQKSCANTEEAVGMPAQTRVNKKNKDTIIAEIGTDLNKDCSIHSETFKPVSLSNSAFTKVQASPEHISAAVIRSKTQEEVISEKFIEGTETRQKEAGCSASCQDSKSTNPGEESDTKQVTVKEMSQAVHNVCKTPKVLSAENSQRVQKTFQQTKHLNDEYSEPVCTNKCLSGQQGKENKQPVRKSSSREHAVGFGNKKREVTEVKTSSKDKCEEKNLNVKMYAAASKSVSNHESNKWPAQLGHGRVLRTAERASSKSNSCMKEDTRGKMIENSGSQGVRTSHRHQHEIRTSVSCTSNRSVRQGTKNNCKVSSAPKGGKQKNQMRTRLQQKELKQGEAVDTLKNEHTSTSESGAVLPISDRTEQTNVFTDVASEDDTAVLSPSKNTRQLNNTLNETVTVVTEVFEFIGKGQPARLKEYEIVKTKMVSDKVKSQKSCANTEEAVGMPAQTRVNKKNKDTIIAEIGTDLNKDCSIHSETFKPVSLSNSAFTKVQASPEHISATVIRSKTQEEVISEKFIEGTETRQKEAGCSASCQDSESTKNVNQLSTEKSLPLGPKYSCVSDHNTANVKPSQSTFVKCKDAVHRAQSSALSPNQRPGPFTCDAGQKKSSELFSGSHVHGQNTNRCLNNMPDHSTAVISFQHRATPPPKNNILIFHGQKWQKLFEKESLERENLRKAAEMRKQRIDEQKWLKEQVEEDTQRKADKQLSESFKQEESRITKEILQRKESQAAKQKWQIAEERLEEVRQRQREAKERLKQAKEEKEQERERQRLEKEKQFANERAARDKIEREKKEERERKIQEEHEKLKAMERERLQREQERKQKRESQQNKLRQSVNKPKNSLPKKSLTPKPLYAIQTSSNNNSISSSHKVTESKQNASNICENLQNYNIEDKVSDDSTDDEEAPKKRIPEWAIGVSLNTALIRQHMNPPDLEEIFQFSNIEPPDLALVFPGRRRLRFKLRTSSAVWNSPPHNHL